MVNNLLKELRSTNSIPHKVAILKRYDSDELREILIAMYHPSNTYNIKIGYVPPIPDSVTGLCKQERTILEMLRKGRLSGNKAQETIAAHTNLYGGLLKLVLSKDMQCGISIKTINQAFPNLIDIVNLQKPKTIPIDKVKFPCWLEIKYDGVRLAVIKNGLEIRILTFNNKEVFLPALRAEFNNLPDGLYDGELVAYKGKSTNRTSVSGLVNSAIHGGEVDESHLTFRIFDCVTLTELRTEKCTVSYEARRIYINAIIPNKQNRPASHHSNYLVLVEAQLVQSPIEANLAYNNLILEGFEGILLKACKSTYKFKRHKDWARQKEVRECDLTCYGYEEGSGKYEGAIGSLKCRGIVTGQLNNVGEYSDYEVDVDVGGLTSALRHKNADCFIGKTIEVKYNQIIQDSVSKEFSLFSPRFVCMRIDK